MEKAVALGIKNGIMMQYFENNILSDSNIWKKVFSEAANLAELGVTAMWIPTADNFKNGAGILDIDLSNMGKSSEFVKAMRELKENMIQVYADIYISGNEESGKLSYWKKWYHNNEEIDGFKLDNIDKDIKDKVVEWLSELRDESGKELFSVGEYWCSDINEIVKHLNTINENMSLFDVPLHYNFYKASKEKGNYDLRYIFKDSLVENNPIRSVTFVDNNKTLIGQCYQSWVEEWFKPLAYALILLREEGYPCIFYGDYYGIISSNIKAMKYILDTLLYVRMNYAFGVQHSYFDNPNIIGWTREGDSERDNSGIAVVISNRYSGRKNMYIGRNHTGKTMYDCTGDRIEEVVIDKSGMGDFPVSGESVSVWVFK